MNFLQSELGKALIGLVIGTILGGLVKTAFDEWSARNKSRRDLIASVTDRVEGLARNYYWLLANNASTLKTQLQDHVEERARIQLSQDPPEHLNEQLKKKIKKAADNSFPYYAAFIKLTYEFNWRAGNTFFLRHYWAGQTIMSLHNEMRLGAFADISNSDIINKTSEIDKDGKPSPLTPADFTCLLNSDTYDDYLRFLQNEERVRTAIKCLRAYNELFHYELSLIYRDWFKNWLGQVRRTPPKARALPRQLTKPTRQTISDVAGKTESEPYAIAALGLNVSEPRLTGSHREPVERAKRMSPPDRAQVKKT